MTIDIPAYDECGLRFAWEPAYSIKCTVDNGSVYLEANRDGLVSLARHLLMLAQENVPDREHFHLDQFNSLEDGSAELVVIRKDTL